MTSISTGRKLNKLNKLEREHMYFEMLLTLQVLAGLAAVIQLGLVSVLVWRVLRIHEILEQALREGQGQEFSEEKLAQAANSTTIPRWMVAVMAVLVIFTIVATVDIFFIHSRQ
jgi:hypothetical protein